MRSSAARKVAELLHGYRLEVEQQGWGTTGGGGMRAELGSASAIAVQLLRVVCRISNDRHANEGAGTSAAPAGRRGVFFAGAREGSTDVRNMAAYSLQLATVLVRRGALGLAELPQRSG